ncbi:MAG: ComEA family DNA-binding protein [Burkholderiaceae bacterium]|jgi:competence protein ComEA|nr:DNA uptake protein [Burkholderiaceae bacterium]NCW84966.1 DNA uptake protein [Oxalobacteraceae bacterium]
MLKKFWLPTLALLMFAGSVFAAVDVNSADQAALDSITGVGPATSKAILAEREKNGNFKDWADLERRVKGVGSRNAVKLSAAGLTVNGKSYEGATAGAKAGKSGDKGAAKSVDKADDKAADKAADKATEKPVTGK